MSDEKTTVVMHTAEGDPTDELSEAVMSEACLKGADGTEEYALIIPVPRSDAR